MSKYKYITIPVVFVIIACIGYVVLHNVSRNQNVLPDQKKVATPEQDSTYGSIFDMIDASKKMTGNMGQKCEWDGQVDSEQSQVSIKGTMYMAGGKARSEVVTTSNSASASAKNVITSYAIIDGEEMVAWTSLTPNNKIKMTVGGLGASTEASLSDFSQQYNFRCEPWVADNSLFVVSD